jgi:hypothetical protein
MHFFDIVNAQPGDTFAIAARASSDGNGGISGVTFDIYVPEPGTAALTMLGMALFGLVRGRRR